MNSCEGEAKYTSRLSRSTRFVFSARKVCSNLASCGSLPSTTLHDPRPAKLSTPAVTCRGQISIDPPSESGSYRTGSTLAGGCSTICGLRFLLTSTVVNCCWPCSMYKNVCPYSRCVYIRVTGAPSKATWASTFTPFGRGAMGELTTTAGNVSVGLTCAKAGRVNEVQKKRAASVANRSPKAGNNVFFVNHLLAFRRSGCRNAD